MNKIIILVIGFVLLVNGCTNITQQAIQNQTSKNTTTKESTNVTQYNSNVGLNIGQSAPDFSLKDPTHGTISKTTFNGKPLFIFFTATYCVPCQIGAQNLARYSDETGGNAFNVLVVFVDGSETDNQLLLWKQRFGRENWYVAKGLDMANTYRVQYLDTKYVLDKNGIIQWIDLNPLTYTSIKPVLEPLIR